MTMHVAPFLLPDIETLLTPIAGPLPAGPSMRYDLLHLSIRQAREEDDASLPMGEWTRPLIKADWKVVAAQCTDLLGQRSKDFQVAAWLCDAWMRLYQVEGFIAGVDLLTCLVERYWETGHPQIEDGDDDARAAPFIWLNENLPLTLMLHLTFIHLPERTPSSISLADWDRTLSPMQQKKNENRRITGPVDRAATRAEMTAYAEGNNLLTLALMGDQLQLAIEKWTNFSSLLDQNMIQNQPSVVRVGDMLKRIAHVVASLINGREPRPQLAVVSPASNTVALFLTPQQETAMTDLTTQELPSGVSTVVLPTGAIASREDAYRLLEAVATYLMKTEPHSPTPYLVKRAVSWGRMSLVDLMQEVVREEGDLTRYFSLLGIKT